MPYHLNLTLQQRATLSFAIAIWNKKEITDKISKWFDNYQKKIGDTITRDWEQLVEEASEEWNQNLLPLQLRGEVINIIKILGMKIVRWYTYIKNVYREIYKETGDKTASIGKIYWTPIGTVDGGKTLESFLRVNNIPNIAAMYNIAFNNELEEDIDDWWEKLPCKLVKDCYDKFYMHEKYNEVKYDEWRNQIHPHYSYYILAYWKYRREGKTDDFTNNIIPRYKFISDDRRTEYNQNYSVEHKMFLISLFKGYSTAVKYFWKKITQKERDSSILYSTHIVAGIDDFLPTICTGASYKKEIYAEILIFLINQMTIDQKESFLKKSPMSDYFRTDTVRTEKCIFSFLSCIWPWRQLFIPVLNDMLQCLEYNTETIDKALYEISRKMIYRIHPAEYSESRSMLHEVWFSTPTFIKQTIQDSPNFELYFNFISNLLDLEDFDSIKMIFNDLKMAHVKKQYIKLGRWHYWKLIMSDKYEFLDQFMEKILLSEKLKIYLKSLINHTAVCENFIDTERYDLADKFLNWKFETIEERKQVKDYLKNNKFFVKWIAKQLMSCEGSVDDTKEKISIFLEWMMESEYEIACFKKDFMKNCPTDIIQENWNNRYCANGFSNKPRQLKQLLA